MACAVAFFGCSCSLFENNGSSAADSSSESSSSSDSEIDKSESNNVKTDYAYDSLTDDYAKELYKELANSIDLSRAPTVTVDGSLDEFQITQALQAYRNDHPETFWLTGESKYYVLDNSTTVEFYYSMEPSEILSAKKTFENKIDNILNDLPSGSDFEKEEYINNYIIENCKYDDAAAQTKNIEGNENDAYGALVDGSAVCEGYARAFQLLCSKADIDCVMVSGTVDNTNHAWNCVKISGEWYQIDVTWNDTDGDKDYLQNDYFNLTDSLMLEDHTLSPKYSNVDAQSFQNVESWCNFYVPKCTAEKYNYYKYKYPTVSDLDNADDVSEALAKSAKNGDKYFSIVVDKNTDFEYMYDEMMNDGYLYNWLTKANEINSNSPMLAQTCYVVRKDNLGVLTLQLDYMN